MSGIRRHCIIVVDGTKYDIVTSARDVANAEAAHKIDAQQSPMMFSLSVVHETLKRLEHPVPADFYDYLDLIDDFDDLESSTEVNPTQEDR